MRIKFSGLISSLLDGFILISNNDDRSSSSSASGDWWGSESGSAFYSMAESCASSETGMKLRSSSREDYD